MIILFHSLYFVVRYIAEAYRVSRAAKAAAAGCHLLNGEVMFQSSVTVDDAFGVTFDPPLYRQRYVTAQQILLNERYRPKIRKIVEFGCGELNFFPYMKHLFGVREIVLVDTDEDVLEENRFRARPLNVDYLKRRSEKLTVQILCGSVGDPDVNLRGADAVIAIELIEHLYPDDLEALPYNIFGFMKPLLVIITTPNSEFNVIFGLDKFRHYDHKFEWTREQFQAWCLNVTERFPVYKVYFDGTGEPPEQSKHLGHCTQYAVFLRDDFANYPSCEQLTPPAEPIDATKGSHGVCTYYSYTAQLRRYENRDAEEPRTLNGHYYKTIDVIEYPYEHDNRTPEQRITEEILYKINSMATPYSRFYNEELDRIECPLYVLVSNEEGYFTTVSEVRTLLENREFRVEECSAAGHEERVPCVVYDLDPAMEDDAASSPSPDNDDGCGAGAAAAAAAAASDPERAPKAVPWTADAGDDSDWDATAPQDAVTTATSRVDDETVTSVQYSLTVSTAAAEEKKPKKGVNVKNRHLPSTSDSSAPPPKPIAVAKNSESSSPDSSSNRTSMKTARSTLKSTVKDNGAVSSTSKKKRKRSIEDPKDDMKNLFECVVYNTLNTVRSRDDTNADDFTFPNTSNDNTMGSDIKDFLDTDPLVTQDSAPITKQQQAGPVASASDLLLLGPSKRIARDLVDDVVDGVRVDELHMASREALFDPNSEVDMLEEFGIPADAATTATAATGAPAPPAAVRNIVLVGLNLAGVAVATTAAAATSSDEDGGVGGGAGGGAGGGVGVAGVAIPENADPFPNWLLQLLGANVEEAGESHDEPHFYCQGDGIGVHPSIIEVEIDEEESSSDTSGDDAAEAERTISESVAGANALPNDEYYQEASPEMAAAATATADGGSSSSGGPPPATATGSSTGSTDEFYDTIEEHTTYTDTSKPTSNDFSDT